ncbi:hypothetical protein WJX84_001608 [Apatococcus fuscideae]|uniref:Tetratricopeptide repeat protein n=1 Tax=Apatococcus fuscideae TaxID=2026836 RepID=A0AAW1SJZ8_9CHLO
MNYPFDDLPPGVALQRLGEVEEDLGNYEEAMDLCKQAMRIRETSSWRGAGCCGLQGRARCLEAMGRLQEAGDFRTSGPRGTDGLICGGGSCAIFASPEDLRTLQGHLPSKRDHARPVNVTEASAHTGQR